MSSIAETQARTEKEIDSKYKAEHSLQLAHRESQAARTLQRTYRGHRERRQLAGLSLDPSTRWVEAIKEAQYRELTRPRPRSSASGQESSDARSLEARQSWRRVGGIARRAGGDAKDDESHSSGHEGDTAQKKPAHQQKQSSPRGNSTQMMDLSYFLEMVDVKHRYGSNLRKYHAEWQRRETHENFFYWLDCGEGKEVSLENCPRERLDAMQVRYLSREERLNYLTMPDEEGRLCWKKNGIRIDTSVKWRDSINGIVPVDDPTPAFDSAARGTQVPAAPANPSSGSESGGIFDADTEKGEKKTTEVPPEQILNRLVRKSSTKSKWIFVADTSYNLYVGIKQSGLIKIRDGKIKLLQPRSGHYRPPASNFLAFIHALRARGVDMSATSVSKSYAALVGIEGYMKGKSALKETKANLSRIMSPEKHHGGDHHDNKEKEGKDGGNREHEGFAKRLTGKLGI
ncbi:MAG: hypothetical protein Q9191_000742 [Dirinaria sp. TL-2023a]